MSGDTLGWKVPSPRESRIESSELNFTGDEGSVKILKVCFCTNNNLGKNFKLVKCDSSWQIRVRVIFKKFGGGRVVMCQKAVIKRLRIRRWCFVFEPEMCLIWHP